MNSLLRRIFLFSTVFTLTICAYGQKGVVTKADKEFDRFSYIDARKIYLKVVEDGYVSAQIYQKLGDTYYYNSQYAEASKWYNKLITEFPSEVGAQYYYKAAQSSKSVGEYGRSDELMELYAQNGGDPYIINIYRTNPNYLNKISENALDLGIEKVQINTAGSDFVGSFMGDDFVFSSTINSTGNKTYDWTDEGYLDLFVASIDEKGQLSGSTAFKGDINSPYHESSTTFTKDGKTMYFTRNNYIDGKKERGKGKIVGLKIYKAKKQDNGSWGEIEELAFNDDNYSTAHPALSPDEKRLYFSSDMPGTLGMSDLWYVNISEDGSMGTPVNMGAKINTTNKESFPFISSENKLFFSSDGHLGLGGLDVFYTQLNAADGHDEIINIGEPANSQFDDFGFIYLDSKEFGYVSSNRDGGEGSVSDDIYLLKRCKITIAGTITNLTSGKIQPNATVTLMDSENKILATTTSDEGGRYTFDPELSCGTIYTVRATAEGCDFIEKVVETPTESGVFEVPLALTCDPCAPNDLGCRLSLQPIYFDFDRYNIRPDAAVELAKILAAMREYPELIIHIESHTDSRGSNSYNEALSEKRAQSTLKWLINQGIDQSRLSAKGYGEYRLVNKCADGIECTEEEHQLNRRSMFIIQN